MIFYKIHSKYVPNITSESVPDRFYPEDIYYEFEIDFNTNSYGCWIWEYLNMNSRPLLYNTKRHFSNADEAMEWILQQRELIGA